MNATTPQDARKDAPRVRLDRRPAVQDPAQLRSSTGVGGPGIVSLPVGFGIAQLVPGGGQPHLPRVAVHVHEPLIVESCAVGLLELSVEAVEEADTTGCRG